MKHFFLIFFIAFGVYSFDMVPTGWGSGLTSIGDYNATELKSQSTILTQTFNITPNANVSLDIHITEYSENYDISNSWLDFISPPLPRFIIADSTSVGGVYSKLERHMQIEPCELKRYYSYYPDGQAYLTINMTLYQEVIDFPSLMTKNWTILVKLKEITKPFPYHSDDILVDGFYQYRSISLTGEYAYYDPQRPNMRISFPSLSGLSFYENKDFVVQISTDTGLISDYLTEVIFAKGDQCIWTFDTLSEDRFVIEIPLTVGNTWNFTVGPARISDWYIAYRTKNYFGTINQKEVIVNYILVDRPVEPKTVIPSPEIPSPGIPTPEILSPVDSSSLIHNVDFNLIIVFILSILIFHK